MKLHEIINAQEANETAFRNCGISRATFESRAADLAKLYAAAMIAAQVAMVHHCASR